MQRSVYFKFNDSDRFGYTLKINSAATAERTITIPDANVTLGAATYQSYVAILTQNTTNAPTAVVLNSSDSNYLGAIVWARDAGGSYSGTLANAFPSGKVVILAAEGGTNGLLKIYRSTNSTIQIDQISLDGTESFIDTFVEQGIEIRVYP
jgi:hypothetical protein